LCLPRGVIHEAVSLDDSHSLHLTISTGYQNTYADFLDVLHKQSVIDYWEKNQDIRKSIPRYLCKIFQNPTDLDNVELENFFFYTQARFFVNEVNSNLSYEKAIRKSKGFKIMERSSVPANLIEVTRKEKTIITEETKIKLNHEFNIKLTISMDGPKIEFFPNNTAKDVDDTRCIRLAPEGAHLIHRLFDCLPNVVTVGELTEIPNVNERFEFIAELFLNGVIVII